MRFVILALLIVPPSISAKDIPADWAFAPYVRPQLPEASKVANPIDRFLLASLKDHKLDFRPELDRPALIRRLTFDLIGLPPTPEEIDAFVNDSSANAYEKAVDRLLASSHFGERTAVAWLDAVRYADSDGFKADDLRPTAWRYRDYVIRSFNSDKPYDRFVQEQLAGDELFPGDADALIATGFLRHYPDEYNAVNLEQRRQEILNDITDTTGQVFLGLTLGCAKCHDHKFDPIPQADYYRLQAFFAGWKPVDPPLQDVEAKAAAEKLHAWELKTAEVRRELAEFERPFRAKFSAGRRFRFPEEYGSLLDIPAAKRTPLQEQIATLVEKQVYAEDAGIFTGLKPEEKQKHEALKKKLAQFGPRPPEPPRVMAMSDTSAAPPTYILKRGNWRIHVDEVHPGFLSTTDDKDAELPPPSGGRLGRRSVLSHWLTKPDNSLTARVEVNRLWQHYFGKGLVGSAGDFGATGERPTNLALLDWLASEFVKPADGKAWSLKHVQRLIVTSRAYRQNSLSDPEGVKIDPDNALLWRQNRKRLDGETLRDSVLSVAGALNPKTGGPGVFPNLPAGLKSNRWTVTADEKERDRRSIYVAVRRNLRYPLFSAFDATDRNEACSRRFETTTAPQALALLNDAFVISNAKRFADRIRKQAPQKVADQIDYAYRLALSRLPTPEERARLESFLAQPRPDAATGLADLCHVLLNLNEFIYLD